ncbi:hypothetical protein GCM10027566_13830 [Arachidicoccus ginsenosidivorans]|jgi:hypothetical protein|nr:DUF3791 domain-containing protein [Arachidicoccus ginsenosidivorans]
MEKHVEQLMLPYKIQQLLGVILEKRNIGVKDAISFLYDSKLYKELSGDDSYLWGLSPYNLYDQLIQEKAEALDRINLSMPILLFLAFCIENYKKHTNFSSEKVLELFNLYGVIDYLVEVYEMLHTQGEGYIMEEIDRFIENRKK